MVKTVVHCVPGLGADHRLFGRLHLPDHELRWLDWPQMPIGSSVKDFAEALSQRVDPRFAHVLLGVSFGGMVVQEMAATTGAQRVVIVSSWKGVREMPMHIRLLQGSHAEKLLVPGFMRRMLPMVRWQMGVQDADDEALLDAFLNTTSLEQLRVQIAAVLGWKGPEQPVRKLVHLHGDKDLLMPVERIVDPIVIKGGTHFMVFNRAEEVSAAIRRALASDDAA